LGAFLNNRWVRRLAMWVLAPVVLLYGFFQYNYPTCTFRYKLTAEVMTPDGLKTGSSVIEVSYSSTHPLPNPGRWREDTVTGEAVYVDLGGGKNLFVLLGVDRWERMASSTPTNEDGFDGLKGGNDYVLEDNLGKGSLNALWLPIQAYKLGRKPGYEREMQRRANALLGQAPVEVPLSNVPMIGTFADLSRPETFNTLTPSEINKVLGDRYELQSVEMQIVEATASPQLESIIGWLFSKPDFSLVECGNSETELRFGKCWANKRYLKAIKSSPDYLG
jgi:hypothetical protein